MRVATEIGEKRVAHSQSAKEQEGMVPLKVCCVCIFCICLFVCRFLVFVLVCFFAHSQSLRNGGHGSP